MNTDQNPDVNPQAHSKKAILKATSIALLVALAILFIAILPAEYNIDPTGLGKILGFSSLAKSKTGTVTDKVVRHQAQVGIFKQGTVELKLTPHQGFEYKFRIEQGGMMLYSWIASKEIEYDFHGEPQDAPKGYFESYEKKTASKEANGSFVASFLGRHGWYLKNNTGETVTIKLTTAGFYEVIGIIDATARTSAAQ